MSNRWSQVLVLKPLNDYPKQTFELALPHGKMLNDDNHPDDHFIKSCPTKSGDYYLYWHLKEHRFITQDEAIVKL